jgi:hypothetical protein
MRQRNRECRALVGVEPTGCDLVCDLVCDPVGAFWQLFPSKQHSPTGRPSTFVNSRLGVQVASSAPPGQAPVTHPRPTGQQGG